MSEQIQSTESASPETAGPYREAAEVAPEPEAEQDRPRVGLIAIAIVTTLLALTGVVIGVNELFRSVFGDEVKSKVLTRPNSELRELRAEEQAKLGRYQWVSKKDGVVRVPLDRAMALTIADYRARAAEAPRGSR